MADLNKAFNVAIAKSKYKNQTEFCSLTGISASTLQPMKKGSKQTQWGTIVKVCENLDVSVVDFIAGGE